MSEPDYHSLLGELQVEEGAVRHILDAVPFSADLLKRVRAELAEIGEECGQAAAAFAFGSLARYDASDCSDLDLGFLYFPDRIPKDGAAALRDKIMARLRSLAIEVPEKTFLRPIPVPDLTSHIGGPAETNEMLTYRALVLTESEWIVGAPTATEIRNAIFYRYTEGMTTRGKNLTSLSNDLHRYYRTLCVDYRFKVEEGRKPWAIRNMKLRHSRKIWHLGNIVAECACLFEENHDARLAELLGQPPLWRIAHGLRRYGKVQVAARLFRAYDAFLQEMADKDVRGALDTLNFEEAYADTKFATMKESAHEVQRAAATILRELAEAPECRDYMERYVWL